MNHKTFQIVIPNVHDVSGRDFSNCFLRKTTYDKLYIQISRSFCEQLQYVFSNYQNMPVQMHLERKFHLTLCTLEWFYLIMNIGNMHFQIVFS